MTRQGLETWHQDSKRQLSLNSSGLAVQRRRQRHEEWSLETVSQSDKEESMEYGRSTQKNGGKLGPVTAKGAQSFQRRRVTAPRLTLVGETGGESSKEEFEGVARDLSCSLQMLLEKSTNYLG